jgi:hypothetical protein
LKKTIIAGIVLVGLASMSYDNPIEFDPDNKGWDGIAFSDMQPETEPLYVSGHACRITYPEYASLNPGRDTLFSVRVKTGCEGQFVNQVGLVETWRWYGAGKGYMTLTFDDGILALRQMDNLL